MRDRLFALGWFVANAAGIGLLAFTDILALRIIGWMWLTFALSLSGLIEVGSMLGTKSSEPSQIDQLLAKYDIPVKE